MAQRILIGLSATLNLLVLVLVLYLWLGTPYRDFIHPRMSASTLSFFEAFPVQAGDIVFLGDSITAGGKWNEMFPSLPVRNRGIGGDRTDDLLARIDPLLKAPVARIIIKIGTNDLGTGVPEDTLLSNYEFLLDRIVSEQPNTQVFVQSVLPRSADYRDQVEAVNAALFVLAEERDLVFIDLYSAFLAEDGSIRDEFTSDELHLSGAGYREWQRLLEPFVR